jgi:hypothetical protein
MANTRNALGNYLSITEQDHVMPSARSRALIEHALGPDHTDYAAAQVYALLMIVGRQETGSANVHFTDCEDIAIAISASIAPGLHKIADAIGQLDRALLTGALAFTPRCRFCPSRMHCASTRLCSPRAQGEKREHRYAPLLGSGQISTFRAGQFTRTDPGRS